MNAFSSPFLIVSSLFANAKQAAKAARLELLRIDLARRVMLFQRILNMLNFS